MIEAYAAMEQGGELQPYQFDPGALGADQVEIDVLYCGICHSDLSMINNDWGFSEYPLVPGHEAVGRVSAVGSAVKTLAPGDAVGVGWHSAFCNSCGHCGSGDHNLCATSTATIASRGGFASKLRVAANAAIPIPDGLAIESVGPLFCGGITVFNPLVQFDIQPTEKAAVVGIGGLGHMALQFLNAWGCEVTAFTSSEAKREEALKLGAHQTLNSRDATEIEAAAGAFDLIISTVNVKLDWNLYLNTLKPKGRLHFVGATLDPLDLNVFNLIGGQRSVSGSPVGSPTTIAQMLDFAALHKLAPVTEEFALSDVNAAIKHLESGNARYRIVLKV